MKTPGALEREAQAELHQLLARTFGACTCSRVLHDSLRKPCPQHDAGDPASWTERNGELLAIRDAKICRPDDGIAPW